MGKQKPTETTGTKKDNAPPVETVKKGEEAQGSTKSERKPVEKNGGTKGDGVRDTKKGSEIDDIFSAGKKKKEQESADGKRPAGEAVGKVRGRSRPVRRFVSADKPSDTVPSYQT
jgi:hypothetical protein